MRRVLVILSGGLDSTTLLAKARANFDKDSVGALSFTYGQKHSKELECAKWQSEHYGVKHYMLDISNVFKFDEHCSLLGHGDVPHVSYEQAAEEGGCSTNVPFRNGVMLSIAVSVAEQLGYDSVWIGAHEDDSELVYPDCSKEFIRYMTCACKQGTTSHVEVLAPFIDFTKADICTEALLLDVDLDHTWSCYEGGDEPCHVCGTCRQREEALATARQRLNA